MSIRLQVDVENLKKRVAELETLLAAKFISAEHGVESEWERLQARVKSLETSLVSKVKGVFGK
jgi:hypothetical protein